MRRMTACLIRPIAALCAVGATLPAAAADPADECPSHGVLLDAAALCDSTLLPLRRPADSDPGRDAAARKWTGLFAAVRATALPASSPDDGRRPLVVLVEPEGSAARAVLRQHTAHDEDNR